MTVMTVRSDIMPGVGLIRRDNWLSGPLHRQVLDYLMQPGWQFGWKSDPVLDRFSFWHKHFAGTLATAGYATPAEQTADCADELAEKAPLLHGLWRRLSEEVLPGHVLVRCYANGLPYGSEGTIHVDAETDTGHTTIYYPHAAWHPNWGGETVFFDAARSDILDCVYPRPNRLVTFAGKIPHAARGVSRLCPVMRLTLMFKTERIDGG